MFELVALRARLRDLERQLAIAIVENLDLDEAVEVYAQIKYINEQIRERKKSITVQYDLN